MRSYAHGFVLAAAIIALAACNSSSDNSPTHQEGENQLPESLQEMVRDLRTDLEARGYEVAEGDWHLFTIEDCEFAIETLGNCLGNNPAAPYVLPTLPLWQNEFVDENMRDLLGPTPDDSWWTYRLDEREALVVLAQLPPPGAYLGLQTYIFSREDEIDPTDEIYQAIAADPFMQSIVFMNAPNPARVLVFASLGDSINNVVIEEQSGAAFEEERFFIITPDATMERELTEALLRAGVAGDEQIFTEPVTAELARLGLDAADDDFMTLIRYALPEDEEAGEQWRQNLPLAILRVRDIDTARAPETYPMPEREERIARSELELAGDVGDLVAAVKQQWEQPNAPEAPFQSLLLWVDLLGEHCLARPMNCLGDTADADYQVSATATLDDGEVLAVVGTLGTATENATYTSLSVNWIPPLVGVTQVSHPHLESSAAAFAETVANTDLLYVQYFARDCGDLAPCLEVTEDMIPQDEAAKIIQRNYVAPGSRRGPDPELLVNPVLIVLDGEMRPARR